MLKATSFQLFFSPILIKFIHPSPWEGQGMGLHSFTFIFYDKIYNIKTKER